MTTAFIRQWIGIGWWVGDEKLETGTISRPVGLVGWRAAGLGTTGQVRCQRAGKKSWGRLTLRQLGAALGFILVVDGFEEI